MSTYKEFVIPCSLMKFALSYAHGQQFNSLPIAFPRTAFKASLNPHLNVNLSSHFVSQDLGLVVYDFGSMLQIFTTNPDTMYKWVLEESLSSLNKYETEKTSVFFVPYSVLRSYGCNDIQLNRSAETNLITDGSFVSKIVIPKFKSVKYYHGEMELFEDEYLQYYANNLNVVEEYDYQDLNITAYNRKIARVETDSAKIAKDLRSLALHEINTAFV